jgi:transaldolase
MNLKEKINFSLWCDFIERDFLQNEFKDLLGKNTIYGATSNPAIFEQSITSSDAYIQQIAMLQDNDEKKIYEELAITDIKSAANIMQNLHEQNHDSGFISIEVDPSLCDDATATIQEGIHLFETIGYNNVMIKVPATKAGYIAMKELTSKGINVNATLIFSVSQAIQCAKALDEGIKQSQKDTQGVVSIFVSRFDRALDDKLETLDIPTAQTGILNATKCYHEIEKFNNENIRTLFASTGVKGDKLSSSYYIDKLIYPNSINTAPLSTINAYISNDIFETSDIPTIQECDEYFELLDKYDIDIVKISDKLLQDGLEAFKLSFKTMLAKLKIEN